jgi:hypothetical protein
MLCILECIDCIDCIDCMLSGLGGGREGALPEGNNETPHSQTGEEQAAIIAEIVSFYH